MSGRGEDPISQTRCFFLWLWPTRRRQLLSFDSSWVSPTSCLLILCFFRYQLWQRSWPSKAGVCPTIRFQSPVIRAPLLSSTDCRFRSRTLSSESGSLFTSNDYVRPLYQTNSSSAFKLYCICRNCFSPALMHILNRLDFRGFPNGNSIAKLIYSFWDTIFLESDWNSE